MDITNMEKVEEILEEMKKLFLDLEDEIKKLEKDIETKELEQQDWLHELELGKLNGLEMVKVAKELKAVRVERRSYKDKLDLLKTVKGFANKFIVKGIVSELETVIKNIKTLKKNQDTRTYNPKVVKNLKCSKQYIKQEEENR